MKGWKIEMYKRKFNLLIINILKKVLLLMAVVSVSQCSGVFGYEPHLDSETTNLIMKKRCS